MSDKSGFPNLVPGFEFLQNLVKNAGAALPGVGQWVAPTIDPAEIEKRIDELRTVQFWLEQNAKMLSATIQALEVQRMTLSTLKTMNVQMADLRDSLQIKVPEQKAGAPAEARPVESLPPAKASGADMPPEGAPAGPSAGMAPPAVDPMQWWGALTKQFTELATNAIQQGAGTGLASAMGRPSVDGVDDAKKADSASTRKASRKSGTKGKRNPDTSKKPKAD